MSQRRVEADRLLQDLCGGERPDDGDTVLFSEDIGWHFGPASVAADDCPEPEEATYPITAIIGNARLAVSTQDTLGSISSLDTKDFETTLGQPEDTLESGVELTDANARPGFVAVSIDEQYAFVVTDGQVPRGGGIGTDFRDEWKYWWIIDISDPSNLSVVSENDWTADMTTWTLPFGDDYDQESHPNSMFYDATSERLYILIRAVDEVAISDPREEANLAEIGGLLCYDVSNRASPELIFEDVLPELPMHFLDITMNSDGTDLFIVGKERLRDSIGSGGVVGDWNAKYRVVRYSLDPCEDEAGELVLTYEGTVEFVNLGFGGQGDSDFRYYTITWDEFNERLFLGHFTHPETGTSGLEDTVRITEILWTVPQAPVIVGDVHSIELPPDAEFVLGMEMESEGDLLYCVFRRVIFGGSRIRLRVLDVSSVGEPENTVELANLDIQNTGVVSPIRPLARTYDNQYLFLKDGSGVSALDISDPTNPVIISSTNSAQGDYIGMIWGPFQNRFLGQKWPRSNPIVGEGGIETTEGNFRYHAFTDIGLDTFTVTVAGVAEVLVVGGGGGGGTGDGGGGGGGGAVIHLTGVVFDVGVYDVVVGDGGDGGVAGADESVEEEWPDGRGKNGNPSRIDFLLYALGGGGGGYASQDIGELFTKGVDGGSGGGEGSSSSGSDSTRVGIGLVEDPIYGEDGGLASIGAFSGRTGGGGGGGDEVGFAGSTSAGGDGGSGPELTDFDDWGDPPGFFGGGGGGGARNSGTDTPGAGGDGGGGAGGDGDGSTGGSVQVADDGVVNTGGGGGGGGGGFDGDLTVAAGGKGGSGLVIIRYPLP